MACIGSVGNRSGGGTIAAGGGRSLVAQAPERRASHRVTARDRRSVRSRPTDVHRPRSEPGTAASSFDPLQQRPAESTRPVQGAHLEADDRRSSSPTPRVPSPLCPRVAELAGRRRLRDVRRSARTSSACRPSRRSRSPTRGQSGLSARRLSARARLAARPCRASRSRSAAVPAWDGTSTMAACSCGTEKFFRPSYAANLITGWIPALAGVAGEAGSRRPRADVGCGHGASTILMAQAYPQSLFVGSETPFNLISRRGPSARGRPATAPATAR